MKMNFQLIFLPFAIVKYKNIPRHKYAERALIMHSSALCKPHIAFYLNELLTKLMNISFFFMEPFNSPNRGNHILSSAEYLTKEEEKRWMDITHLDKQVNLCNMRVS